ncbi:MAG: hypothetical protein K2X28_03275 [Alphaproteobacteria bacterium]|nr:hypothetical protein [Alphaproteobacteria bacterium]
MKRFLTLLTLSFLSTSTFVKAGKFNILDLPTSPEERTASLRAKANRLQKKINNTKNVDLIEALTQQKRFVDTLLDNSLTDELYDTYDNIKNKKGKIKATFLEEIRQTDDKSLSHKIYRTLRAEIYAPESQEGRELEAAIRAFERTTYGREVDKDAEATGRLLTSIAPHIQKADQKIDAYMANAGKIKADFQRIKESGDERDLKILEHWLPYESDGGRIVREALDRLSSIGTSLVPESDPKSDPKTDSTGYPLRMFREHQAQDILGYKSIKRRLEPLLAHYRQLKQDAPAFINSVFSGANGYAKLEEDLSIHYDPHSADMPREVREFLFIMGKIRQLPLLLTNLKQLQPQAQEGLLLEQPQHFFTQDFSSGYEAFLPAPGEVSEQETPTFIASVFSAGSDYGKLEQRLFSLYGDDSRGTPPEVKEFLHIMKEIRELPLQIMMLKQFQPQAQELLGSLPSLGLAHVPSLELNAAPASSSNNSARITYENYWKDFLPKMGESFRGYNHSPLPDAEILKVLFPGLREGEVPSLEVAKAKFSELAKGGRPYAKLFTPPESVGSSSESSSGSSRSESMGSSYEEYFRGDFLQKMGNSFRKYNNSTLSDDAILKVLFPNLPEGEVPLTFALYIVGR